MPNNMELDRPHRSTTSTSDLFICFTSRLSHSSSMRLSSKSILSPGRNDSKNPTMSLTNSLSRRLRSNNGSLKGGQSPMFPPGVVSSKKRGCAFENPEPSSPKVTCIGQVRVKTKKQGKKMKMNMKAIRARRITNTKTTTTICDAFRDFSCFIPCRSSSSCEKRSKDENQEKETSFCGGAVLRWFVAFNEGEGKSRDIELVVGDEVEVEKEKVIEREFSRRRSIFDDMNFNIDEICENVEGNNKDKDEGSRVSICIPPKNALLLMRCRSDPVKMSALANKFWDSPPTKDFDEEIEEKIESLIEECDEKEEIEEERRISVREDEKIESLIEHRCSIVSEDEFGNLAKIESLIEHRCSIVSEDEFGNLAMLFEEEEDPDEGQFCDPNESIEVEEEDPDEIQYTVIGKDSIFEIIEEEEQSKLAETQVRSEENSPESSEEDEEFSKNQVLPDCLLLMMCEPKLSMEVSKETWVCSTDFLKPWLPDRHRQHQLRKINGGDEPKIKKVKNNNKKKNRSNNESNHLPPLPPEIQPSRSSCSFPITMANVIEKKLVSAAVGYEPFVLTRCKSEPMRTASAKLGSAPVWKNRKIEPQPRRLLR